MREVDMLQGARCGVIGCGRLAYHSRFKIAVFQIVERVCKVEFFLCDEHNELAEMHPGQFEFVQEKALTWDAPLVKLLKEVA